MTNRFPCHRPALWIATLALLLLGGCATLQVDVDVYKGPLAHEPEIQVRQYASMAISAKPLLQNLLCNAEKEKPRPSTEQIGRDSADGGTVRPKNLGISSCSPEELNKECDKYKDLKSQFLCEVLDLYRDQGGKKDTKHSDASRGLDQLTKAVTDAMAASAGRVRKEDIDVKVNALSDALIFFAQKMLYVTNNELLYGEVPKKNEQQDPVVAVLQSLGNTILVHANDLRRQTNISLAQKQSAGSENNAVQQAFEPEASVTMQMIIFRLKTFSTNNPAAEAEKFMTSATAEQQDELARLGKQEEIYQTEIASLTAAFRTISAEPPASLKTIAATAVDILSADQDRVAIAALFPANAPADAAAPPLKPLLDWLDRELANGVVTSPIRPDRLRKVKVYLASEADRLSAFGMRSTTKQSETLAAL